MRVLPLPCVKGEDQGEGFPRRFNVDQIVSRALPSSKVDPIAPESQNQNIFARNSGREAEHRHSAGAPRGYSIRGSF